MDVYLDSVESPAGPLAFAVDDTGALRLLTFLDGHYERTMEEEIARAGMHAVRDTGRTARARHELAEYTTGDRYQFSLPLALIGSPWQLRVWQALTRIPFGKTRTYAQVAAMVDQPRATRAVGRANATNRLPLVVPCHRVLGSNGALTGFAGGMQIKQRLLEHEARLVGTVPATASGRAGG